MNPGCVGTVSHEDWWNEQIDRCLNGYTTGGVYIPGRYYYYLNFNQLLTVGRGYHYPDYVDLDLEFFNLVNFVKAEGQYKNDPTAGGKGIISLKRRRSGVSHKFAQGIFSYGVRFNPSGYAAGVVAGVKDYAEGFYQKFKENESRVPPELMLKNQSDDDLWNAVYERRSTHGNWLKDGSMNKIYCRTAQANENVFKGAVLNDCGFEEAGEFKKLAECYSSTKACFMSGMQMIGSPFVWGTGGKMKSSSKAFKELLEDAEANDLIPFDIMGPRMQIGFFIGSTGADGKVVEDCPNIKKKYGHLQPEQILGCEDVQRASDVILQKRIQLSKAVNKKPYYEYFQDNPFNRKEAFLNFSANPFDPDILANRLNELTMSPKKYRKVKLEWKVDKDGVRVQPPEVEVIPAKDSDDESECCLMHTDPMCQPMPNHKNLDVAGCDSYDLDVSATSKSLGGFCITRRRHPRDGFIWKKPIFIIRMRPKRKEVFFDNCLKASVLYNLLQNVLIDVANPSIFIHFRQNSGNKYLAPRPKAFESPNSDQDHKQGVKITTYNKPQLIAMEQTWVNDYSHECDFPHVLGEISEYDSEQIDSDWDLADAHMLSLLRDVDLGRKAPMNNDDKPKADSGDMGMWQTVNGVMVEMRDDSEVEKTKLEPGMGFDKRTGFGSPS
jgi:hypothetical protein